MKQHFARLTSTERRFVVGVLVMFFVVLNAMFVWPRFSDWGKTRDRLDKARRTTKRFEREIAEKPKYERLVKVMESEGLAVPQEDQSYDFVRTIQNQAVESGISINRSAAGRQSGRTNQFFLEKSQNLDVQSGEQELVDFLYKLGSGNSLIRVRTLSIRPDLPRRQALNTTVELIASYQKKSATRSPATAAPAAVKPATPTNKKS